MCQTTLQSFTYRMEAARTPPPAELSLLRSSVSWLSLRAAVWSDWCRSPTWCSRLRSAGHSCAEKKRREREKVRVNSTEMKLDRKLDGYALRQLSVFIFYDKWIKKSFFFFAGVAPTVLPVLQAVGSIPAVSRPCLSLLRWWGPACCLLSSPAPPWSPPAELLTKNTHTHKDKKTPTHKNRGGRHTHTHTHTHTHRCVHRHEHTHSNTQNIEISG